VGAAWAGEFAIALVLMIVVLGMTNHAPLAAWTPLVVGALVATFIVVEAPLSGMSMNPARTLGSAAWAGGRAGAWGQLWIYFTAPPLAMLAAAGLFVAAGGHARCAKLDHRAPGPCHFRCEFARAPGATPAPAAGIQPTTTPSPGAGGP
jgi:aquaporin Z